MDIILYNIVTAFCSLFFGYIFGSIPTGVMVGKLIYHRDPRQEGSKNSGGTNVGRLFGKKAGVLVIILDMLKCVLPTISAWAIISFSGLSEALASDTWSQFHILYIYLTPLGVALGHCWPLFGGFKGGKAVATFCGFAACSCWAILILGVITFFTTLKAKKYVSLASIITSLVASILAWILFVLKITVFPSQIDIVMWGAGSFLVCGWEFASVLTLISLMLIIRHRANIVRLVRHEERKIKWMK
ncbi:MAG: glycerol-3-phosphate 1-O-acyltransferase PlsY [Bacilli bacterium]|nr:glycerol-3-phosphate 1-O-acyltransferase PlsY [Bacilli bacterium]